MTIQQVSLNCFLVRPALNPGESWQGYLSRLAAENYLGGVNAIARILKVTALSLVLGELRQDKDGLSIVLGDTVRWSSCSRDSGRSLCARICPACFSQSRPTALSCWDRPLTLRCVRHGCMLIDRCPGCSKPIRHDRKFFENCECGTCFKDAERLPVPSWVFAMEETYEEAIHVREGSTFHSSTQIERDAVRLLRCTSQPHSSPMAEKVPFHKWILSDEFSRLEKAFAGDADGLAPSFSHRGHMSDKRHAWTKKAPQFRRLRERIAHGKWLPSALVDSHVRLSELVPLLAVSYSTLCAHAPKWFGADFDNTVQYSKSKRRVLLRAARFHTIVREVESTVSLHSAAERLGVSAALAKRLVAQGSLSQPSAPYLRQFVLKDDVDKLNQQLNAISESMPSTLGKAHRAADLIRSFGNASAADEDQLILSLLDGSLRSYRACANAQGFRDLLISESDLTAWRRGATRKVA